MRSLLFTLCFLSALASWGAKDSTKIQKSFFQSKATPISEISAIVSTNLAELAQNRTSANLSVMVFPRVAATLGYSSMSERLVRENTVSKSKFTVDRSRVGVGADYYFRPLSSKVNYALSPSFIFQNERDAFTTSSSNGVGLKALATYRPFPRLMGQGGLETTLVGSRTTADLVVGMGLLF